MLYKENYKVSTNVNDLFDLECRYNGVLKVNFKISNGNLHFRQHQNYQRSSGLHNFLI